MFYDHKEQLYNIYHTYSASCSPADITECDFAEGYMTLHDFGRLVDGNFMFRVPTRCPPLLDVLLIVLLTYS